MRIDQLAIALLSPLAVWLTQQPGNERRQRWACVVGLVSQPSGSGACGSQETGGSVSDV